MDVPLDHDMTWRHVALIALAIVLVLGCGMSHVCAGAPDVRSGILQLAATIIGGVFGHVTHSSILDMATRSTKRNEGDREQ